MKKIFLGIIIALILSLTTYKVADFLCEIEVKCKNCPQISLNKENSKRNGFFVSDYKKFKQTFELKNHSEKIIITDIWVEKQWFYNSDNCLCKKSESNEKFNVVIEFKKSNSDTFLFGLTPIINNKRDESNGGIEETRKTMEFDFFPTELNLILSEKNPGKNIGWKKEIVTDTLKIKLTE